MLDKDSDCDFDGYLDEDDFEGTLVQPMKGRVSSSLSSQFLTLPPTTITSVVSTATGCSVDTSDMGPVDSFQQLVTAKILTRCRQDAGRNC